MNQPMLSIIIPTYQNEEMALQCLRSIALTIDPIASLVEIILVNNGHPEAFPKEIPTYLKVINPGKNLGWEGGLKEGLKHTTAPFVMFLNDDTYFPISSLSWLTRLIHVFNDPLVGATGPSSNFVMGLQNMFLETPSMWLETKYLIGFCMIVRREALDKVGGVDDTMPGGDDLDLSIRLRDAGYKLICNRQVFVYHHGAQTGGKTQGAYWNSQEMQEKTNLALIKKHGMSKFFETINGWRDLKGYGNYLSFEDTEGDMIRANLNGESSILELGCGAIKTHERSIGMDITPKGEIVDYLNGVRSIADVVGNVEETLPFKDEEFEAIIARHILEHCIDSVGVMKEWMRVLKPGGKLIIAVPQEGRTKTIPLNPDHFHAFTKTNLKNLTELCGLKTKEINDSGNGISFVGVFIK